MTPTALLRLLLAAALNSAILSDVNTGNEFIVVFPENIAYYHPSDPQNQILVTVLHDNTLVEVKTQTSTLERHGGLSAGATQVYTVDKTLELHKSRISDGVIQISSNNDVIVQAISQKNNSMQSAVVIPIQKLDKKYLIPPVPAAVGGTNDSTTGVNTEVTERGPFRVIIVNADANNTVTIGGQNSTEVSLSPWQAAQMWVGPERVVTADHPVAVLFGHPCSVRYNCTCGMLYVALQPARDEEQMFFIPPHLATDAEAETLVLLSQESSTDTMTFDPESPLVKTAGTVVLYRPGLLLSLIPEADFAGCYVVRSIFGIDNFAVIVVNEMDKDKVRIGTAALETSDWQELKGTDYVSVKVQLQPGISTIWHTSSKIAVYFLGRKNGTLFGNPGHIVGKFPDYRGCALTSLAVDIGETAMAWRESLQYCRGKGLEMLSFSSTEMHQLVSEHLMETKNDSLTEVWMGMRRSSLTGEWYWADGRPPGDSFWGDGEPGAAHEGQCAKMSLEKFVWSDEDCCKDVRPVCVHNPVFFKDSQNNTQR